jgi:hypothetical protein
MCVMLEQRGLRTKNMVRSVVERNWNVIDPIRSKRPPGLPPMWVKQGLISAFLVECN